MVLGVIFVFNISFGNLAGVVYDRSTHQPLPGASVIIKGTELGASTDENGRYFISHIPVGEYSIEASMIGYKPLVKTRVKILAKRCVDLDFGLEVSPIELEAITVRPDYFPKERAQATSSSQLTYHEIRTDPEGYNLPRMLSSLPGVATAEDYSAEIIVRGGEPDENLTIIDGIEVESPVHFPELGGSGGVASIVNTDLVRDMQFSSGGFSARYGNKLSSFMDIKMRDGNRESFEAGFDLSMVGASFTLEGPITDKANYILCYRRSYLDLLDKFSDIGDVIPVYSDYYLRLAYNPSANDRLSLLGIKTQNYLLVPEKDIIFGENLTWKGGMGILGLNYQRLLGTRSYLRTTLGFDDNWDKIEAGDELFYRSKKRGILSSLLFNSEISPNLSLEAGVEGGRFWRGESVYMASHLSPTGDSVLEVNVSGDTLTYRYGLFLQTRLQPFWLLAIMPGIRYDYLHLNDSYAISPRLNLSFYFTPLTTFNLAYGWFYQPMDYLLIMRNPKLRFKKAIHYIIGVEHLLSPSMMLRTEGYYKELSSIPVPGSREPNTGLDSLATGLSKGVEVFLHKKLTAHFYGRSSYSYGISTREDWRGRYHSDWDQRHLLTIIGGWKITKDMEFSLKYRYASGRPYTSYDTTRKFQDPRTGRWYCPMEEEINSSRYPAYSRLDLQWARTDHIGPITITSYINIQNLFDRRNVYAYWWDTKEGELKTAYQFYRMIVGGVHIAF